MLADGFQELILEPVLVALKRQRIDRGIVETERRKRGKP